MKTNRKRSRYTAAVKKMPDGRTIVTLDNTVGFDFRDDDLKQYGIEEIQTGDRVSVLGRYGPELLLLAAPNSLVNIRILKK